MRSIVTITPLSVEVDSRTFKQAASVARFGYRSIVVEGWPSDLDRASLPFELHPIRTRQEAPRATASSTGGRTSRLRTAVRSAMGRKELVSPPDLIGFPLLVLYYLAAYFYHCCLLPLTAIPRASLYYLHSFDYFPAVYLLSRRYGAPFIYDAHDYYQGITAPGDLPGFERRFGWPFRRAIEGLCVRNAAAVVTVNDSIARLIRDEFGRNEILALQNAQDLRLERQPAQHLRDQLGLSSDVFLLVCVGQAKKEQAVQEALEALTLLPECVHLAFVGKNHEPRLSMLRRFRLESRVHLVPPVKPFEVCSYIQSADASVILYYPLAPNVRNCSPNGLFQSIAAELPILYPDLPEIARLAGAYDLGLPIDPQSPQSIRQAVLRLLQDPSLRSRYKGNAQRAKVELSWEREEPILRDLLAQVLPRSRGAC